MPWLDRRAQDAPALAQQPRAQRLLQLQQVAGLEQFVVAVDLGKQALLGRHRHHLRHVQAQDLGRIGTLGRDLQLHLLGRTQRVPHGVDLVEHDQPGGVPLTQGGQVLAPDAEIGLGDAGVGGQDEHHGMRLRQQAHREFGLGADGVEPGGVENDQPLLEQRVGHVDERMAPFGHLDQAVRAGQRVVLGQFVVPETQGTRLFDRDTPHLGHLVDRARQLLGVVHVEIDPLPFVITDCP